LEMVTDLEVPDSPMSRQGLPEPTAVLSSQDVLQVNQRSSVLVPCCCC
jgi:hypothetical protein